MLPSIILCLLSLPGALFQKGKSGPDIFKLEDTIDIKQFLRTTLYIWTVKASGEQRGITDKVDFVTRETRRSVYFMRNETLSGLPRTVRLKGKFLKLSRKRHPMAILVGRVGGKQIQVEEIIYQDNNNTCAVFWTTYLRRFRHKNTKGDDEDLCELRVKSRTRTPTPSAECNEAFEDICLGKKTLLDKRE
ncbi:uncharacterized protein LOC144142212 [Haemaphysalis longicornis]